MALDTYANLQLEIQAWLARADADIVARIPAFITLAEASFKRKLRNHWRSEKRATVDTTAADGFILLPSDFLEMRSLHLNTNPKRQLEYKTPQQIRDLWLGSETRRPEVFSIVGGEIMLGPIPDAVYELEMDYFAFESLSDSNTANWLLTYYPDVYLYGSLVQAEPYLGADQRMGTWTSLAINGMNEVLSENKRAKRSGPMTVSSDVGVI